jgi:hypothetical protein
MLTGKRFTLKKSILALDATEGTRTAVTVPAGAVIKVTSGPSREDDTGTVSVLWDGRTVAMFAIDIRSRGAECPEQCAKA